MIGSSHDGILPDGDSVAQVTHPEPRAEPRTETRIETRRVRPDEVGDVIVVAARAFFDDPLMAYFLPTWRSQQLGLVSFFAAPIHDCARHGEVWGAFVDGRARGVAAWLPPGVGLPIRGKRALDQLRRGASGAFRTGGRLRAAIALMNTVAASHPSEPHWYLGVLGVDPTFQGRGLGAALLAPQHDRADAASLPCFLETQKPENLPYYRRFGYEVVDEIQVGACPPIWTMERHPRPD